MTRDPKQADQGNVRDSEEGVEVAAVETEGEPATGLIGNGKMTDPRYLAPR
jgi:hypothetical protein